MNKFYTAFKREVSWFNSKGESTDVYDISDFTLTDKFRSTFPVLTELINQSHKTGIDTDENSYLLFSWEKENHISGWLCQLDDPIIEVIEEHQILLDNIVGIVESFNGPEKMVVNGVNYNYSLTLNQDFMFVGSRCTEHLDWEEYYLEKCKDANLRPMDLNSKVFFTREANGAKYFYDKKTRTVNLFSTDHAFNFVNPLPNQPEYTMHSIQGVESFIEFVELAAQQWLSHIKGL